jgi:hypothetical protein
MNTLAINLMFWSLLISPAVVLGQSARLHLPDFSRLEKQATDVVDISLDASLLRLAGRFMGETTAEDRAAKEILQGLGGIYVKSFVFEHEYRYSKADIDKVRSQLSAPGWSRMVTVRSKRERNDVDVYMRTGNDDRKISGMVIVAAAPHAFTIVNIVGSVDLEKLRQLEGKFGVPKLHIDHEP